MKSQVKLEAVPTFISVLGLFDVEYRTGLRIDLELFGGFNSQGRSSLTPPLAEAFPIRTWLRRHPQQNISLGQEGNM